MEDFKTKLTSSNEKRVDDFVHLHVLKVDWNNSLKVSGVWLVPNDGAAGIEYVAKNEGTSTDGRYYNLNGQVVNNPTNASFDQISIVPSFDPTVTPKDGQHSGGLGGEGYNTKVLLGDVLELDSSVVDGLLDTANVLMLRTTFGYCSFSLREISDSYPDLQSIKCNLTKDGVEIYVDGKLYKSYGSADFSSSIPY